MASDPTIVIGVRWRRPKRAGARPSPPTAPRWSAATGRPVPCASSMTLIRRPRAACGVEQRHEVTGERKQDDRRSPQVIATAMASTDASTDAMPLMPQAHGTAPDAGLQPPEPDRHGHAQREPGGASSTTVSATRVANGSWISARSSGWSPKAVAAISTQAERERHDQRAARVAQARGQQRADAGEDEQREQHHRQRVGREAEEQHEALDQRDLEQQEAEPDRGEEEQRRSAGGRAPRGTSRSGSTNASAESTSRMASVSAGAQRVGGEEVAGGGFAARSRAASC